MIGTIKGSFLGFRIGFDSPALQPSRFRQNIIQRRIPQPYHHDVPGPPPGIDAIHVDVGNCLSQRIERVLHVVFRAEQPFLFRGQ